MAVAFQHTCDCTVCFSRILAAHILFSVCALVGLSECHLCTPSTPWFCGTDSQYDAVPADEPVRPLIEILSPLCNTTLVFGKAFVLQVSAFHGTLEGWALEVRARLISRSPTKADFYVGRRFNEVCTLPMHIQARARKHACTHAHTHARARTHASTQARTHVIKCPDRTCGSNIQIDVLTAWSNVRKESYVVVHGSRT